MWKPHTSTADLLTWSETPAAVAPGTHSAARSHQKGISEFFDNGGSKEKVDLQFKEDDDLVEHCFGPGIVVNIEELKVLVGDGNGLVVVRIRPENGHEREGDRMVRKISDDSVTESLLSFQFSTQN
ncbi:hypothetical protein U1Q18_027642 [Sarracenia purpurea var. burkii]